MKLLTLIQFTIYNFQGDFANSTMNMTVCRKRPKLGVYTIGAPLIASTTDTISCNTLNKRGHDGSKLAVANQKKARKTDH